MSIIGIRINGQFLELFPDTSINLKLENPIFADNVVIPGGYSLPFSVPGGEDSDANAVIFSAPDIISSTQSRYEFTGVQLLIEFLLYKTGSLLVDTADSRKTNANFRFSLKNIRPDFKDYKIRDLVDESITITTETYYKKIVAVHGGGVASPYKLVVNDDTYEGATLQDLADAIDAVVNFSASYETAGSTFGVSGPRVEVEPAIVPELVSQEFSVKFTTEQDITGSDITSDPQTDFLTAYTAWLDAFYNTPINDYLYIPVFRNFRTNSIDDFINQVSATGYDLGRLTDIPKKGQPYIPYVTLKRVFETMSAEFGITFKGTFFDNPKYSKALWYHTRSFWQDMEYIKGVDYRFYNSSFNVRDLVPDITVDQLLKGLQRKNNLSIIISDTGREITINYRKASITDKIYVDWTSISGPVRPVDFTETTTGYKLDGNQEKNDARDQPDTYIYGDPEKTISSIIGSIYNDFAIDGFSMPHTGQEYDSDFIPRLFYYIGITDNAGLDYQQASADPTETHYGGAGNLGETQWKEYLRFLSSRKMTTSGIDLQYRQLNVIDFEQKKMIDGTTYLVRSIDIKLTTRKIELAKVELYKVL